MNALWVFVFVLTLWLLPGLVILSVNFWDRIPPIGQFIQDIQFYFATIDYSHRINIHSDIPGSETRTPGTICEPRGSFSGNWFDFQVVPSSNWGYWDELARIGKRRGLIIILKEKFPNKSKSEIFYLAKILYKSYYEGK